MQFVIGSVVVNAFANGILGVLDQLKRNSEAEDEPG
jgi:hypothetical protein